MSIYSKPSSSINRWDDRIKFLDITQKAKVQILRWSDDGPEERRTDAGLNLQGKCCNKNCEAFGKWAINKGVTTYDHVYDEHENKCPLCFRYVNVESCAFNNCRYGYSGIKPEKGLPPQKVISQKEIEGGDHYKFFDPEIVGNAIWTTLKIATKKLVEKWSQRKCFAESAERKSSLMGESLSVLIFHGECLQKTQEIIPVCSYCHF